jgi:hypothetical protein
MEYRWQFYLRRATINPHFARALGLLFWGLSMNSRHQFQYFCRSGK